MPQGGDGASSEGAAYVEPAALPPPPGAATLAEVMPYLGKLALGDGSLHWRLAAALVLLVA